MNGLPTVAVLLAVYEPGDALIEQLKSISQQVGVNIVLYIGDDGSSSDVKMKYKDYLPESCHYFSYDRIGPGQNFMNLLSNTHDEDYFAFSDQDDIWLEDKLLKHLSILSLENGVIAGTHSNSAVLRGKKVSLKKSRCNEHHLSQLLAENCVQGCTLVINQKARDLICSVKNQSVIWHDWWIGLVLSSVGKLIYVPGTDTLYRIHQENVIGLPGFKERVKRSFERHPGALLNQHKLFLDSYSTHMRENDSKVLQNWIRNWDRCFLGRLLSAVTDRKRKKSIVDDVSRRIIGVLKKP
jgi:glycosyltransferase involved in cell wall biosynthesis